MFDGVSEVGVPPPPVDADGKVLLWEFGHVMTDAPHERVHVVVVQSSVEENAVRNRDTSINHEGKTATIERWRSIWRPDSL